MLVTLSILAALLAGLTKGPWWFWLVASATVVLLSLTDPARLRPRYADLGGLDAVPRLLDDLRIISVCSAVCAAAFTLGRLISWVLPV
jgi:hypothetical protein